MNETLNTPPTTFPQYTYPLFPTYDEAHSSTGDGIRRSNLSNENEKEINMMKKMKKCFVSYK